MADADRARHADFSPELTSRLGMVVIRWSAVEAWISALVATAVSADPGAMQAVTRTAGVKTQIDWIKNVIAVHIDKEPDLQEILGLPDRANEIREERNLVVHGVWEWIDDPDCALIQDVRIERTEMIRSILITTAELDELLREIDVWVADYAELGRKFGFPRLRNSDRSIFSET